MSKGQSLQRVLASAKEREKEYDWLKAAELYEQALGAVGKRNFLEEGKIWERVGFCFHRAAMQAESREEFKERMQRAIEVYEDAGRTFEEMTDKEKVAWMFRCEAVAKYLGYWVTSDASEKRKLLDECLELEGKALTVFLESGDMLEYGRTYNELSLVFSLRYFLEWDRQTSKRVLERGLKWGKKAVASLSELGNSYEVARAYFTLATCLGFLWKFIAEPEELDKNRLKIIEHLNKAVEFSEGIGDVFLAGLSHLWLGLYTGGEESVTHFEKVLECGEKIGDNLLKGGGLSFLASRIYLKAVATEDPDQRRKLAEDAMKLYDKSQYHYAIISFRGARTVVTAPPGGYAEHYLQLAVWETDPIEKLDLLEKSEKAGMEALKLAEDSDMPLVISDVLHVISKTLQARSRVELDSTEKRSRLEKALKYREKAIEIHERQAPFLGMWSLGVMQNYLAGIKAELADIEPDPNSRSKLLEEAVLRKEKGLELCSKIISFYEKIGDITLFAELQEYQDAYATLLTRLYDLTNKAEHLKKAIEISQKAIESARKLDLISLMAESHWKIAKAQDILGEHLKAAESFERASKSYMKAAEKIPQLGAFYQDYAGYMEAWGEIEKAKHHHAKRQLEQAKEHYERASNIHKSADRWNHLSQNYLALARLEEAENLSRNERAEEAINLFQQAAKLFAEAKKSINAKLEKIEVRDEKEMVAELVKASDVRCDYSLGRIALEKAKILDRKGDHVASSKEYESAAETFKKIANVESGQSRRELQPIVYLCQAWQKMMMAEAKASSTMYGEAAELFKQAKEHTLNRQTSLFALGNSSFCKALEAGTEFEITRETTRYSTAKKHMEAAENYYLKAGFKTASEYAKATYMLFDAYMYSNKAQTETGPRKKARYYQMAEKLLQASAGSYKKAKHPEKSEEVQRLLESVKEKRQLAMSLTEVLHAPRIASTTTSFSTPTPTHEKAVGLERFEHTNVQAHLTASEEVTIGEELEVRLDLVNVAKNFGLLVRADNLAPPSFKVTTLPSQYSIENGSIDMKGKRLEPLKVESIKLSLQATEAGVIELKPQVVYVDEVGKFSTCKPEPVTITVHPKLTFEFKTKTAQNIFDFLISSFVEDYMRRRISLEKSGWRTLMQIIKQAKVSKSNVYGVRGRRGPAVSELERRGLVETRVFPGERGRGGRILKMRISYEKETIKRHIDQRIMKIKEK